ncbi:Alpha/Beta hydrolase protein [Pestalotiopsis sp. NC0098]|nr:Alpha/Beta hydrolase protein [Pestalotiopsis sp. NC0098]
MRLSTAISQAALQVGLAQAIVVPASLARDVTNTTACAQNHLLLARGSTESYPGVLGDLASAVIDVLSNTTYENVIYPATDETTTDSYFVGRTAFADQLGQYAEACPDSKIAVLSYSQGAMIVGDALVGGGGQQYLGNATEPLVSESLGQRITALMHYGNPRHVPLEPFNIGNGTFNATGKYPRLSEQITVLNERYAGVIADYCNSGDPVCAQGSNLTAHLVYPTVWGTAAADWLVSMLQ